MRTTNGKMFSIKPTSYLLTNLALTSLIVLVSLFLFARVQFTTGQRQSFGSLQRSFSDPRLNRNNSYNYNNQFQRQSSFRDNHCSINYKFDYVQLTLQWAPGTCSTSPQACKRIENKHFTVHGMWPTLRGTQEPANCCFDNTFDYKALEPIMATLQDYWYSYFDSNSRRFWSHEWLKHGTCSRDVPALKGEANYFGKTVELAKKLPILEELKKAGIVPDNNKTYDSSQILKALGQISQGKSIGIDCDYEHDQPIPILTGLNFCFDANLKPANCPDMKKRCKRQVLFLDHSHVR